MGSLPLKLRFLKTCFSVKVRFCDCLELEARVAAESGSEDGCPPANHVKTIGEGGDSGDIIAGKSLVFATLEVVLCVLVRHIPGINPSLPSAKSPNLRPHRLSEEACQLVSTVLNVMVDLPPLCSHSGKEENHTQHVLWC